MDSSSAGNFVCKICFEPFSRDQRHPISLNCGHTFCICCVKQLGRNGSSIFCGLCRRNTYFDYRLLGKNVTLIDLLEFANLLADDGPGEVSEVEPSAPWQGPNRFISSSQLTVFLDRLADLRANVRQFLPSTQWNHFDEQLDGIRSTFSTIENKLREAGDLFTSQDGKLEQLENKFQRTMAEQYQQSTSNHNQSLVRIPWALSDESGDDDVLALLRTNTRNPTRHPSRRRARTARHRRHNNNNNRQNNNNGSSEFYNFGQQLRMNGSNLEFDSWGIMGNDAWDQSAQSIGTYDLVGLDGLTEQQAVDNDEGDEDDADTFWSIESALNPSPPTESLELLDQQNDIEPLPMTSEPLPMTSEPLPMTSEPLPTSSELLPTSFEPLPTSFEPLPTSSEPLPTSPLAHVATAHSSIDHKRKRLPVSPKHVVKLRGSAVVIRSFDVLIIFCPISSDLFYPMHMFRQNLPH
uniref:RING-type domain-containing protein n=1 Tax=Globodera rostochiensis TaxID=31243 RepID=A0A914HVS1_GLORO